MAITANDVKDLREKTGAGMMDCKKALEEAKGDLEQAIVVLRKKGLASAQKKSARAAAEGGREGNDSGHDRRAQLQRAGHRGWDRGPEHRGGTLPDVPAADGALRRIGPADRPPDSLVDQRYAQSRAGEAAIRTERRLVHPHAQPSQTRTVKETGEQETFQHGDAEDRIDVAPSMRCAQRN